MRITTENPQQKATYDMMLAQNRAKKEVQDLKTKAKSELQEMLDASLIAYVYG